MKCRARFDNAARMLLENLSEELSYSNHCLGVPGATSQSGMFAIGVVSRFCQMCNYFIESVTADCKARGRMLEMKCSRCLVAHMV